MNRSPAITHLVAGLFVALVLSGCAEVHHFQKTTIRQYQVGYDIENKVIGAEATFTPK